MHRMGAHRRKLACAKQATSSMTLTARAHRAWQEHTRRLRDLAIAADAAHLRIQQSGHRHVSLVRQAPARFTARWAQSALAMRATRGLPEATAQSAWQESSRRYRDHPHARHVPQAHIQQLSGPQWHPHAKVVRQAPAHFKGAQSALAMRATRGLTEARAQRAWLERTKRRQDQPCATLVQQTPTRLRGAQFRRAASATRAPRDMLEASARRVMQEVTLRHRD